MVLSKIHEDLQRLVGFLPEHQAAIVKQLVEALIEKDGEQPATDALERNAEDRAWLNSDLSRLGEYEPYDWGTGGVPKGQPVRYVFGVGFMVEDGDGRE